MLISQKEIIFYPALGKTEQEVWFSLSKRPEYSKFREREPKPKTILSQTYQSEFLEEPNGWWEESWREKEKLFIAQTQGNSVNFYETKYNGNYYDNEVNAEEIDGANIDKMFQAGPIVALEIENPNPLLFEIYPSYFFFNEFDYNIPRKVTFKLKDRRTHSVYYQNLKIYSSSGDDEFYADNEFYYAISVVVPERGLGGNKTQDLNTTEIYNFPPNYWANKKLKINTIRIVGCYFNMTLTSKETIKFGDSVYLVGDVAPFYVRTGGIISLMPGDYPEFAPVAGEAIDISGWAVVGIDGRIMDGPGSAGFTGRAGWPTTLEFCISDKYKINIPLSSFTKSGSVGVQGYMNIGPLSYASMDYKIDLELNAEDFIDIHGNGDSSFYFYGKTLGGNPDIYENPSEQFTQGFTLNSPFRLQVDAEITEDPPYILNDDRAAIYHYAIGAKNNNFIPLGAGWAGATEIFPIGRGMNGPIGAIKSIRDGDEFFEVTHFNNGNISAFHRTTEVITITPNSHPSLAWIGTSTLNDEGTTSFNFIPSGKFINNISSFQTSGALPGDVGFNTYFDNVNLYNYELVGVIHNDSTTLIVKAYLEPAITEDEPEEDNTDWGGMSHRERREHDADESDEGGEEENLGPVEEFFTFDYKQITRYGFFYGIK